MTNELNLGTDKMISPDRTDAWIQTYTGLRFYPWAPTVEMIRIEDMAHAVSFINRWTGATRFPISVAYHMRLVWRLATLLFPDRRDVQQWAVVHDCAEGYICDIARPIRRNIPEFEQLDENVTRVIGEFFGLSWPIPKEVWYLDNLQLGLENKYAVTERIPGLMEDIVEEFEDQHPSYKHEIWEVDWCRAKLTWLSSLCAAGLLR